MKTISVRELHGDMAKWLDAVKGEKEIVVTKRGVAIARILPPLVVPKKKYTWANRPLVPGYAAAMKAGKLKTGGDSSVYISEDRTSRDNSVAGIQE